MTFFFFCACACAPHNLLGGTLPLGNPTSKWLKAVYLMKKQATLYDGQWWANLPLTGPHNAWLTNTTGLYPLKLLFRPQQNSLTKFNYFYSLPDSADVVVPLPLWFSGL